MNDREFASRKVMLPPYLLRILVPLVFVLMLSALVPGLPTNAMEHATSKPETLLGQTWWWFGANKDALSALSALFGGGSLMVAAFAFLRTQALNRATAYFQILKEVRDLRIQMALEPSGVNPLIVGLNFYASIDQYRFLGLIDSLAWKSFEQELRSLVQTDAVRDWLDNKQGTGEAKLPPLGGFDPRFVSYLRMLRAVPE